MRLKEKRERERSLRARKEDHCCDDIDHWLNFYFSFIFFIL